MSNLYKIQKCKTCGHDFKCIQYIPTADIRTNTIPQCDIVKLPCCVNSPSFLSSHVFNRKVLKIAQDFLCFFLGGEEPTRHSFSLTEHFHCWLPWDHGIIQCSAQSTLNQVLLQHSKSKKTKENVLITFVLVWRLQFRCSCSLETIVLLFFCWLHFHCTFRSFQWLHFCCSFVDYFFIVVFVLLFGECFLFVCFLFVLFFGGDYSFLVFFCLVLPTSSHMLFVVVVVFPTVTGCQTNKQTNTIFMKLKKEYMYHVGMLYRNIKTISVSSCNQNIWSKKAR